MAGSILPRLEPRTRVPAGLHFLVPLVSITLAFVVVGIFLELRGYDSLEIFKEIFVTAFGSTFGIGDTLASATPLILTGLAAAVAFRVQLWNIGAEGQLYLGAIAASGVALLVGPSVPKPIAIVLVIVAGLVGGALWIVPVAVAKAFLNVNEILTSLMLNFVALLLMRYLIFGSSSPWRDLEVSQMPRGARIDPLYKLPNLGDTRLHAGLFLALAAAFAVWFMLRHMMFGFKMRILDSSERAARYAGISVRGVTLKVLVLSGALAGLAGAIELSGRSGGLDPEGLAINLGYTGIVVAALGGWSPVGIVIVAIFLGGIENASTTLQSLSQRVPVSISTIIEGTLILFAIAGMTSVRYRWRWGGRGLAPVARAPGSARSEPPPPEPSPDQPTAAGPVEHPTPSRKPA
jgi:simple sugar transport system permease protein